MIEMLAESVTTRIIWGSERLLNALDFTKSLNDVAVKASALITMDL